jgi:single-strand DNA-binding protein
MSVNRVTLLGRVGKQPEVKTFSGGGSIAVFSLATSERWTDKKTGEKKEKTEWHNIKVTVPALVTLVEKYVKKGDNLYLEGAIESREYEKDGVKHRAFEIVLGFNGKIDLIGGARGGGDTAAPVEEVKTESVPLDDDIPF